jgi:hypothetical protein
MDRLPAYDEVVDFYAQGDSVATVEQMKYVGIDYHYRPTSTYRKPNSGNEPTEGDIATYMAENPGLGWYHAREELRSIAYGGSPHATPPGGFTDWGTYWKCY